MVLRPRLARKLQGRPISGRNDVVKGLSALIYLSLSLSCFSLVYGPRSCWEAAGTYVFGSHSFFEPVKISTAGLMPLVCSSGWEKEGTLTKITPSFSLFVPIAVPQLGQKLRRTKLPLSASGVR